MRDNVFGGAGMCNQKMTIPRRNHKGILFSARAVDREDRPLYAHSGQTSKGFQLSHGGQKAEEPRKSKYVYVCVVRDGTTGTVVAKNQAP